jgi:hypothetical protein
VTRKIQFAILGYLSDGYVGSISRGVLIGLDKIYVLAKEVTPRILCLLRYQILGGKCSVVGSDRKETLARVSRNSHEGVAIESTQHRSEHSVPV